MSHGKRSKTVPGRALLLGVIGFFFDCVFDGRGGGRVRCLCEAKQGCLDVESDWSGGVGVPDVSDESKAGSRVGFFSAIQRGGWVEFFSPCQPPMKTRFCVFSLPGPPASL